MLSRYSLLFITLGFAAVMFAFSIWAWPQIPETALVPIHWGMKGTPDGFAPKGAALLAIPLLSLSMAFIVNYQWRLSAESYPESARLAPIMWSATLLLLTVCHGLICFSGIGLNLPVVRIVLTGVGLLMILSGALVMRIRTATGKRTVWPLTRDSSWARYNRFMGALLDVFGITLLVASPKPVLAACVLIAGVGAILVGSVAYNFHLYRQEQSV